MSEQYPGGYLTGSPVIPTASRAPGIWSLSQQASYQAAGTWPTIPDAQFNYVTMLLHGDGLNTAQNNTFSDSSSNNFTCTRNGNPTQGSFSPYGDYWSNYFGGTEYLTGPTTNSAFDFGSGDWTIETWAFPTAFSSQMAVFISLDNATSSAYAVGLLINTNGSVRVYQYGGSYFINSTSTTGVVSLNAWSHIAAVRSGSTFAIFVNGTRVASVTGVSGTQAANKTVNIGQDPYASNLRFRGYLSNLRVVKGTAVYNPSDSTITVPTTALTAISGTSLLTCQSNRFKDSSSNAFTITANGTPSVQRFNPFGANTVYGASTTGGSGYFDGSSDYLSAISGGTALTFGTNDFTVEGWVYPTVSALNGLFQISIGTTGLQASPSNTVAVFQGTTDWQIYAAGNTQASSAYTINLNSWYHFAVVRSAKVTKLYINGVQVISVADTTNYTGSYMCIGAAYNTSYIADGYLSDIRVVNGTALYTSAFTPPTVPLTAVANTQLLYAMTGAGVVDNALMNDLETVGNAQISTSVKKYGTGSLYFDGTGDYLKLPVSQNFNFGYGDFTIEGWVNLPSVGATFQTIFCTGYTVQIYAYGGTIYTYLNDSDDTNSYIITGLAGPLSSISANTWAHFAVVRNGSTFTCYINGVAGTPMSSSGNVLLSATAPTVGATIVGASYPFTGYIDDLRITKGYARYTTTFTPPTAAFPNYGPY